MAWDLKMPSWDLAELEQNAESNIGSVLGSTRVLGRQASVLDCSVDLKLGGLGDFGSTEKWRDQPRVSTTMDSSSGSSKRARAPSNGGQNVACLVDGCKSDLSNCREYHRRHKVCEVHSKTPIVMVAGQEQRFCQQCSRFHLLVEFDEVKRSCRKRLDGHNRRRRKPQPESINAGSLFVNHQGSRLSTYPSIFPTSAADPAWAAIVKTEDSLYGHHSPMHFVERHQHFPCTSFSRSFRESKQFPFLQDGNASLSSRTSTIEPSVCQPLLKTFPSAENSSSKLFSNGLTQVLDSDCALSLLSSPSPSSVINNLGQMDRIPMGQPLLSGLHYGSLGLGRYSSSQASNNVSTTGFSSSGIEVDHVGTVLVSDTNDADLNCQGLFSAGGEGTSDGAAHALSFSWQQ